MEKIQMLTDETNPVLHTVEPPKGRLDFLGYVVCPLKHLFKESFEAVLQKYRQETGVALRCYVPMGCGGPDLYEDIWKAGNIEDFPDMVVSVGLDNLYKKEFIEKFVVPGCFTAIQTEPVPQVFDGIPDPRKAYSIYGVFPYVMMVDHGKLESLPVPKRWSDLIDPGYRNNIIIGGPDWVNELLLLDLYKELGETSIKQLAANVKDTWHAAQMAKTAGTGSEKGAAIYVLPWFFAKTCPHTRMVSIIWPEDGALVNPMYFLIKKSRYKELGPLVDFITGAEFGAKMAETYFPVLHPETCNHLPEKARFKWLGWDFVYSRDMGGLIEYVTKIFMDEWQKPK